MNTGPNEILLTVAHDNLARAKQNAAGAQSALDNAAYLLDAANAAVKEAEDELKAAQKEAA